MGQPNPAVNVLWTSRSLLAEVCADLPVFSFDSDSLLEPDPSSQHPNLSESEVRQKIATLVSSSRAVEPEDESSFRDAIREHQQVPAARPDLTLPYLTITEPDLT